MRKVALNERYTITWIQLYRKRGSLHDSSLTTHTDRHSLLYTHNVTLSLTLNPKGQIPVS